MLYSHSQLRAFNVTATLVAPTFLTDFTSAISTLYG